MEIGNNLYNKVKIFIIKERAQYKIFMNVKNRKYKTKLVLTSKFLNEIFLKCHFAKICQDFRIKIVKDM